MQTESAVLTPDDVSVLLGVPRQYVMRQAKLGKLPAIKIGKSWRFLRASIEEWLRSQEQQCAA